MRHLLALTLHHDQDVVTARQRAVHLAQLLGFETSEQTRIATAVSEIVRNAFRYATGGTVAFAVDEESRPQRLVVRVSDRGPGIARLDDVLSGRYRSSTGMGLGIVGARRLMDGFSIESSPAGTSVVLEKAFSPRQDVVTAARARHIAETVARRRPDGLLEEVQHQNQELLRAFDELQHKQQELVHLNRELEDTNRGVVALYAELDEKADHLRRADELKSRFLSNMTHEFRTPVNSIIGLSNLLIDDAQREGREPAPEVSYIRQAAEQLSELVNDLLDLAKVEAGKTVVRSSRFEIHSLFGALRGMLRPLLLNQSVSLVFDDVEGLPPLESDEPKLSQILRNLISNALKFTERGEVRVSAGMIDDDTVVFRVADTGIGIAPEDQPRIFEEFTQLEHRLQRHVRGTGLGLPLSRRLAELLGGTLSVESEPGAGSTFSVTLPAHYSARRSPAAVEWRPVEGRLPVLVLEDAPDAHYFYDKVLRSSRFQVYPAFTVGDAEAALDRIQPAVIVLDVMLGEEDAWGFLEHVTRDDRTRQVPVLVVSSAPDRDQALRRGARAFLPKPLDRRLLLNMLDTLSRPTARPTRVLVVDDEDVARYLIRQCLPIPAFELTEATSVAEGIRRATTEHPDVILLDLVMPDGDGRAVLRAVRQQSNGHGIPVVIVTSQALSEEERETLLKEAQGVMSKADLTRETLAASVRAAVGQGPDDRMKPLTHSVPS